MKNFKLDSELKIKSGFKAPEHYFNSLTDRVMQQVYAQENTTIPLRRNKTAWFSGIAAVFVIALTVSLFFLIETEETYPDDDAIENYLVYQSGISSYDFVQELNEEDLNELESSMAISDETIESYFENYGDDIYLNE